MEYILLGLFFIILFVFSYYFKLSYVFFSIILAVIFGIIYMFFLRNYFDLNVFYNIKNNFSFFYENVFIFLFFYLGLGYNFNKIYKILLKSISPSLLDLINLIVPFLLFFAIFRDFFIAFIFSLIIYPSSTAIIVKKLENYKLLFSKQADFLLGVLLFEDIVLILALSFISTKKFALSYFLIGIILFFITILFLNKIFNKYKKNIELILDSDLGIFLIFGILLFTTWLFYQVFYLPYFISSFVLGLSLGEYLADKIRLKIDVFKDLALSSFMFLFFFDSILNQKEISFLFNEYLVLILAIILLFLKLLTTYIGAKNFGVSKKNLFNVSFLSLIRGEFSIVAVSFIPKYFLLALVIVIFTNLLATLFFYLFYNPKTELSINK
ncbi:MAG: cation:proton antiporter [bacterium]|nr:cation:proton antiporter [bacterium]